MKKKSFLTVTIIAITFLTLFPTNSTEDGELPATPLCGDALMPKDLLKKSSHITALSHLPSRYTSSDVEPRYMETSEYLIGSVAVGVIFLESNGTIDPSTEDWSSTRESTVVSKIRYGLTWLANYCPSAHISFSFDIHYQVPTGYEPIIHQGPDDECLWISEAMSFLGYRGSDYFSQVRDYINALRDTMGTDWAFSMFIVDSYQDVDGCFADGNFFAYAYLGGPFLVMTYDNDGWGISRMDRVAAHETCHIFYATDEYDNTPEYSGYLNIKDNDGSGDLMDRNLWSLCINSQQQLGWRDIDGDQILDIVDTFPNTFINPFSPDPANETVLNYWGTAMEVPYPNMNPYGPQKDITINRITNVEFRVDQGTWKKATAVDGIFNETFEEFTFTTSWLSYDIHTVEARATNSVNNTESSYASDDIRCIRTVLAVPQNFSAIQVAINAATAGVNVHVFPRTYYENLFVNKTILLGGESKENTIIDGNQAGHVIQVTANYVIVSGFTIRNASYSNSDSGIYLNSSNNKITGNTISYNPSGISINSSENIIYHNNFINNTVQANVTAGHTNFWDNGYPSGGNYWSDYAGTDQYCGLYQNETGSDGIGDIPHVIDEFNRDRYPLIKPWAPPNIAIENVTASKTVLGKGRTLYINVTVANQVDKTEAFDIKVYANTTLIATQEVVLSGANSTTVTFLWNTANIAQGNYTISTYAAPATDEIFLDDNICIYGWVVVTREGDATGDNVVNIFDIVAVGVSFGSTPSDSNWNPNADLREDQEINIFDLVTVALNYG